MIKHLKPRSKDEIEEFRLNDFKKEICLKFFYCNKIIGKIPIDVKNEIKRLIDSNAIGNNMIIKLIENKYD
jgi:hypothetical protein